MKATKSHEPQNAHNKMTNKNKALVFILSAVLGLALILFLRPQTPFKTDINGESEITTSTSLSQNGINAGINAEKSKNPSKPSTTLKVKGDTLPFSFKEIASLATQPSAVPPPSVFEQKEVKKRGAKPESLHFRRNGLEEDNEEEEDHESPEKEQADKAFWSEERDRFDFDMLKDPVTGVIPRTAGLMAAESAQRFKANKEGALNGRAAPITVTPRGPNNLGGRTRAIGIDKRNANIMLAGSVSSGVFRTTNGGASWTRVAPIGQIHNVTAIAQDPRAGQENTWYYGTGESLGNSAALGSNYNGNGIWKSTDNGITWSPLASTITAIETFSTAFDFVHRIVVDPTTGYVYAAAGNTIQRSTNGGATWATVLGSLANNRYTDIIVTPTGRLYAAFDGRDPLAGVWTSTTGASTTSWTKIGVPSVTPGWNPANTYGRTVLAYAPSNPNIVFALYWNGQNGGVEAELFKWDNATGAWTDLSANLPNEPGGVSSGNNPFAVQTGYDLVVAVKPDDVNTVFVGGTNAYRSTSGFTNTTATKRIGGYNSPAGYALYPNHHPDNHIFVFANGDNNTLYTGNDGGIQKANILAPTVAWTPLNNNYVTYQYYHADIDPANGSPVIAGGAQDNGTTINIGGSAFYSVFGGDGCQTAIISYSDPSNFNILAASQNGNLVRITGNDGWYVYPESSSAGIFVTYYQLDQDNVDYLYYADNAALYRTRNASKLEETTEGDPSVAWQKMPSIGLVGNIRSMATSRDNAYCGLDYTASDAKRKLYIGTSAGRVYRLNDPAFAASTAAAVNITPPTASVNSLCSSIAVNPFDDNEIIVTFSNYNVISVFHTLNANSATPTWTAVEGPAGTPLQLGSARSSIITRVGTTKTYIVGNSTGLYATQALNGTATVWEQVSPTEINYAICASMRLRVSDNTIVLGTHGNGMFELKLPPVEELVVLNCPSDINKDSEIGKCSAVVTYSPFSTGTPAPTLTYKFEGATTGTGSGDGSGSIFNVGVTTVTLFADNGCKQTCTFKVTVKDVEKPVVACKNLSLDFTYGGSAPITPQDVLASVFDNCGTIQSLSLDRTIPFNSGDVPGKTLILTVTDLAGNKSTCEAKITVTQSAIAQVICPDSKIINFEDIGPNGIPATAATTTFPEGLNSMTSTDKILDLTCNSTSVTRPDGLPFDANFNTTMATGAYKVVARTFSATFTGFSSTCSQVFYLKKPDFTKIIKAPNASAVCLNGIPYLKPEDLSSANTRYNGTGFPRFANGNTITDVSQGLQTSYTDAPVNNGVIVRTWSIKDKCDIYTTFTQNITIPTCVTPQVSISGDIKRETGDAVAAMVKIYSSKDSINKVEGSFYNFPAMAMGESYRIRPERNNDILNGVTTYDIAMISKYLLGLEPAKSPYQLIAMDVDRSGEIDASDMILVRNLILRKSTTFPNNTAWRFIPKSYVFKNPENPFAEDFPEVLSISNPSQNVENADFVAVKIGDGNLTARISNLVSAQVRSLPETGFLQITDRVLDEGKEYRIPVKINEKSLVALEFALNFDKNAVESFKIENGDLAQFSEGNYNIISKKTLAMAWASAKATSDNTVFTLIIKTKKQISIKDLLSLNTSLSGNLAFNTGGAEKHLQLRFDNDKTDNAQFELYQNRPNPFSNETTISFILPETNTAELSIYDITGRRLYSLNGPFTKGYNEVILTNTILKTTGLYFYRLQTDKFNAVKRMRYFAD
jgi:Dockerin type I domain